MKISSCVTRSGKFKAADLHDPTTRSTVSVVLEALHSLSRVCRKFHRVCDAIESHDAIECVTLSRVGPVMRAPICISSAKRSCDTLSLLLSLSLSFSGASSRVCWTPSRVCWTLSRVCRKLCRVCDPTGDAGADLHELGETLVRHRRQQLLRRLLLRRALRWELLRVRGGAREASFGRRLHHIHQHGLVYWAA